MTLYRLSPEAVSDLQEIKTYLTRNGSTRIARHVLRAIRLAFRLLAEQPGVGHRREDLADEPARFWSVFSYMIVYDPTSQPVSIARVLHGSQDLQTLLRTGGADP